MSDDGPQPIAVSRLTLGSARVEPKQLSRGVWHEYRDCYGTEQHESKSRGVEVAAPIEAPVLELLDTR